MSLVSADHFLGRCLSLLLTLVALVVVHVGMGQKEDRPDSELDWFLPEEEKRRKFVWGRENVIH